jgi:hypothetical protein
MKFFTFVQNNSGGTWVFDTEAGLAPYVIIEAHDAEHANERAEQIGIYFDGCEAGKDCTCCGDRWGPCYPHDATETPRIYDEPVEAFKSAYYRHRTPKLVFVHYADGRKVAHGEQA